MELTALPRGSLSAQFLSSCCGLSNSTPNRLAEGQRITEIVCVQNYYDWRRGDDAFRMLSPNKR